MRQSWNLGSLAAAGAVLLGFASLAKAAAAEGDGLPSFMLPNIVAILMIVAVVAIACRRFRQT